MAVLITNMDMPKHCFTVENKRFKYCKLYDVCEYKDLRHGNVPSDCPLKSADEILDFAKKGLSDNSVLEDIYEEMRQEYEDYSARDYYNTAYGLYCAMGIVKKHMEGVNDETD